MFDCLSEATQHNNGKVKTPKAEGWYDDGHLVEVMASMINTIIIFKCISWVGNIIWNINNTRQVSFCPTGDSQVDCEIIKKEKYQYTAC